jgi:hypothetical protein
MEESMTSKNPLRRLVLVGTLACMGVAISVLAPRIPFNEAHAGPPTSSVVVDVIPRTPPSTKGPKGTAKPPTAADRQPVAQCLKARYDSLTAKIPGIRLKHLTDDGAFWDEYAAEKEAHVGQKALEAAGCTK